jgi:hypothetical protein
MYPGQGSFVAPMSDCQWRRSCCHPPSNEGAGIAAVAVVIGAAVAYAKVGPEVARIWHLAVGAVLIFTLGCAAAAAGIVITWATAHYIRTQRTPRQALVVPVSPNAQSSIGQPGSEPECLACGDTGTVLRAIGNSSYQHESCPACQPTHRAG